MWQVMEMNTQRCREAAPEVELAGEEGPLGENEVDKRIE